MKLTHYGHSCFRLDLPGAVVLIDPFFTGNRSFSGDVASATAGTTHILITHGHGDHVGDTLEIAARTGATVVSNFDLLMFLASKGLTTFSPMNMGGTVDFGAFRVAMVRADHSSGQVEQGVAFPLGNPTGVIVSAEGQPTLWHMGDTDIFSDMALIAEIHRVDVCICPIGDRFTMGGKLAAMAMKRFVKPRLAIPCHYGTFDMIDQTPALFLSEMAQSGIDVLVPPLGEAVPL
jgi:L-ascorbate metabolism protein UlaG (beta-lactamase superfamily)